MALPSRTRRLLTELCDPACLAAQFVKFALRRPITYIVESAPHSTRRLKRRWPWFYFHLTLQWAQLWRRHLIADAFLVSFPKSGRTWLRAMVEHALEHEYGKGAADGLWQVIHDDDPFWKRPEELARRKPEYRHKKVILLVREPKDVIVSSYFHKHDRQGMYDETLKTYLGEQVGGLDTWLRYHEIWRASASVPKAFLEISYEEMHADAAGVLRRVLAFLERPVSEEALTAGVDYGSFGQMRAREVASARESTRTESLKARKGEVGGHREYLSAETVRDLDRRIRSFESAAPPP